MSRTRPLPVCALVVCASMAWAVPAWGQPDTSVAGDYIERVWGTRDGLPQNTVSSIVQTRDGYLWLGTFGGLVRFDGHSFTVFDPENTPGLASARVIRMREDRQGVLWIGTEAGLTKYEGGRFTTYTTRDGLPRDEIIALRDDRRGRLWVATEGGLARFDGRTFERLSLGDLFAAGHVIAETPDGDIWVCSNGVVRFKGGEGPGEIVKRGDAHTMLVDSAGRLWLAARRLNRWNGTQFVEVPAPRQIDGRSPLNTLTEASDGSLFVHSVDEGRIYRWREGDADAVTVATGLGGNFRSLLLDAGGNMWIGTDISGLKRLKRRRVFTYLEPGAPANFAPIVDDGADGLWVGSPCGGLFHVRAGAFERVDRLPFEARCVWALMRDPDGTLWIGSNGGLTRLRAGQFARYARAQGLAHDFVTSIFRDRDGTLWVGTGAGLSRFDGERFTNLGPAGEQRMVAITQDRAGVMWLGGFGGLYRFANGVFTHYTKADGLANNYVRAIHEDADGVLWIGTYGGGLHRFKDGRFVPFGPKAGLPDTAVSRIIEDDHGQMWMSGNRGIVRVARRDLNDYADGKISYVTSVSFGMADGMVIDETNGGFPAGWRARDGKLWFPTIQGLVSIEPESGAAPPLAVFVEHVLADGRDMGTASATLGTGSVDVEFRYTAIDLAAAEKSRFRYRLDGYDRQWIEAGDRRSAFYTQVPPGSYRFEVSAANADGVWSTEAARIAFVVAPHWWQRREVQVVSLVLLLVVTGLVVRELSLRRARARVAELEREQALTRERTRIARDLHDDLGSRLAQIAMIAERAEVSPPIERIASVSREAMQTMDELVWSVNARNDTAESFAEYAAEFAQEHLGLADVRCRLHIAGDLEGRQLGADARRHLFMAFKEAIHNAVKHAQATEVRIDIRLEGTMVVVEVSDNGRGIPEVLASGTGNGLHNMRERMVAAGGSLQIDSPASGGAHLVFRAPCESA